MSKLFRRRTVVTTAAMVLLMTSAACSSSSTESGGTGGTGGEGRTITVATSNDAPFAFTVNGDRLSGIDGEMINAIAKKKNWTIKPFVTEFATLIAALKGKKADVLADAMYITDERKKQIAFTDVWYTQGEGMLVPGDSTLTSREDVKGKILGGQTGTVFADFIGTLGGSQTKFFDSQAALITAVENKQVDAAFTDSAVVAYSLVQKPNPKIKLVTPYTPFFPGKIGAGVRTEDTQLLADLNAGLKELKTTPEYVAILKKYGLTEQNAAK